ncbi:MAG: nucleotide exchange factor GrpE [Deltaproteobacteria bacterium]|nr:nucleotide exchange factor GrpE [Deltaproteobacteria bacterium]
MDKTNPEDKQPTDGQEEENVIEIPVDDCSNENTDDACEETSFEGGKEDELSLAKKEAKDASEALLLKTAEIENYRKRIEKEKRSHMDFANEGLIKSILPSIDNLERALLHANQECSEEDSSKSANTEGSLKRGVELTLKDLKNALEKFGLETFTSEGTPFDPNIHEAISYEESATTESDFITKEHQRGYKLNGRLLRPALVVVAKKVSSH